jgi:hypothetical protein
MDDLRTWYSVTDCQWSPGSALASTSRAERSIESRPAGGKTLIASSYVDTHEWGYVVTKDSGFAFVIAAVVALVRRRPRLAGYLGALAYIMLFPILLWIEQFGLTQRHAVPPWYIGSAVFQITVGGIGPLIWKCFRRRFRPVLTALLVVFVFSLLLQFFAYIYWTFGTTRNFSIRLSHLDAFYFALGTLTTAGTGTISAVSETARGLQTLQMGLDLALVGFVVALVLARYSGLLTRPQGGNAR